MKETIRISVCCTCHNRREKTIRCIESLFNQKGIDDGKFELKVFLCDDGSTDNTVIDIRKKFPKVNIINGSGNLFWARGMEKAFSEAKQHETDFYLMVNDDVEFYYDMLENVYAAYQSAKSKFDKVAVVGSIKDPITGEWSYGGKKWKLRLCRDVKTTVYPQEPYAECELANWNCFFMPVSLANEVGNIEKIYEHAMADYDYSIRILKCGGHIVTSGKYVGTCSRNDIKGTWQDVSLPLRERYKLLHKRIARPVKSYKHYCKVAYGNMWIYWFCIQYIWIAKTSLEYKIKG